MDKRRLGLNLLIVGLVFLAALHVVLGLAFGTGLSQLSLLAIVVLLVVLVVVNVGAGASEESNP